MNENRMESTCPICGGSPDVVVTNKPYRIVECRTCCMGYRSPKPSRDELDAYYSVAQTSTHTIDRRIRELQATQRLAELSRRADIARAACVLDVGCDDGLFLRVVKERYPGIDVYGIEPSSKRAELAGSVCGSQNVQAASLEEATFNRSFDLITAFHVLEHVREPARFIDRLRQLMGPHSLLCLEVPTVSLSRLDLPFGARLLAPGYTRSPEHLWFFKPRSFRLLLERNGLRIMDMSCVTFGLQPGVNSFVMRHAPSMFPLYRVISRTLVFPFNVTGNGKQVMAIAQSDA